MVNEISQNRKTSVNRTYKIIGIAKSGHFYKRKRPEDSDIEKELSDLARKHLRWGFGKIFSYLRNKKLSWNHKRVYRVYRKLGLNLR